MIKFTIDHTCIVLKSLTDIFEEKRRFSLPLSKLLYVRCKTEKQNGVKPVSAFLSNLPRPLQGFPSLK